MIFTRRFVLSANINVYVYSKSIRFNRIIKDTLRAIIDFVRRVPIKIYCTDQADLRASLLFHVCIQFESFPNANKLELETVLSTLFDANITRNRLLTLLSFLSHGQTVFRDQTKLTP